MAYGKKEKEKKPDPGYVRLKKDLKEKKPGQLYVFHGEEIYLRDWYYKMLKDQLLAGGMGDFNLHELPQGTVTPRTLEEAVDCLPMMGERTLVSIVDFDLFKAGEADRNEFCRILSSLPDYCCVVFLYDEIPFSGDARTKLYKVLKEKGTIASFEYQNENDLADWLTRRFRAMDKDIKRDTALFIVRRCGKDMTFLASEAEKIGCYARGREITQEDVTAVTLPQPEVQAFSLMNAVGDRDFNSAVLILNQMFQLQENIFGVIGQLSTQMRRLYSARLALDSRRGPGYLADLWGISDFACQNLLNSARRMDTQWCRHAVLRLQEIENMVKGASPGRGQQDILTGYILELAQTIRQPAGRR